jgi:hypothetical protein
VFCRANWYDDNDVFSLVVNNVVCSSCSLSFDDELDTSIGGEVGALVVERSVLDRVFARMIWSRVRVGVRVSIIRC